MNILLIRHGKTQGNLLKKYIGKTDESLCEAGKNELLEKEFSQVKTVITSPLKRCVETAKILFPRSENYIYDDLQECDFGDFENYNFEELKENKDYQQWLDSNGQMPFPHGESHEAFKARCCAAFLRAIDEHRESCLAFVVHGGTIMAVLERFAVPHKDFFNWQVKNGCGFLVDFDLRKKTCEVIKELT